MTTLKGRCYAVARARGPIFESTRFPEILVLPTKFHWNWLSGLAPRLDQSFVDRQTDGNVQNKGTLASSQSSFRKTPNEQVSTELPRNVKYTSKYHAKNSHMCAILSEVKNVQ